MHGHLDHHPPIGRAGDSMHLHPPLVPGGSDIAEVLPDSVVADISPAADGENGQELDLRVADRQCGVDVVAIDRLRKAAYRSFVHRLHRVKYLPTRRPAERSPRGREPTKTGPTPHRAVAA